MLKRLQPALGIMLLLASVLTTNIGFSSNTYARSIIECEQQYAIYGGCEETCSVTPVSGTAKSTASGDGGGCGVNENGGKANQDQVWGYFNNKFKEAGYTAEEAEKATAGIMGNWLQESAFNSYRTDGVGCTGASGPITGSAGMGIAQWCGDRQQNLADFAAERGTEWTCLGTQLEFTWQEMGERGLHEDMKGLTPSQASQMFDEVFEVSDGSGERQKKGEQMYTEYTGKDPGALSSGSSTSGGPNNNCPPSSTGGIMSGDCKELIAKMNSLKGTRIIHNVPGVQQDIDNCTPDPIPRCSGYAVNPPTLRGIIAMAENAGVGSVMVWNINGDHGCDRFDHPIGLATDIGECNGEAATSDAPECKKVFDYLLANAGALNIKYIMWEGSHCRSVAATADNVYCRGDHADHIHVSFNFEGDASTGDGGPSDL